MPQLESVHCNKRSCMMQLRPDSAKQLRDTEVFIISGGLISTWKDWPVLTPVAGGQEDREVTSWALSPQACRLPSCYPVHHWRPSGAERGMGGTIKPVGGVFEREGRKGKPQSAAPLVQSGCKFLLSQQGAARAEERYLIQATRSNT